MTVKSTNNESGASDKRRAIFAGSFNPFTVGHASIVERGLELFDEIIIVVGVNRDKPLADAESRAEKILNRYNNDTRVRVMIWNGLMAELALREHCRFFLRGIRGVADMEYEFNMADVNRRLCGAETVFLATLPEHRAISSSLVRELESYGVDIDKCIMQNQTLNKNNL